MNVARLEAFLYSEADMLDACDLDNWIALFTDDGSYWMPACEAQPDPENHVSHIYDDRVMMEIRRRNFVHPRSSSKEWDIRTSHILGNVRVRDLGESGVFKVTSNQHVVVWYREEQRTYAYRGTHLLVERDDQLLIKQKRVDLINPSAPQRSLIIYI